MQPPRSLKINLNHENRVAGGDEYIKVAIRWVRPETPVVELTIPWPHDPTV